MGASRTARSAQLSKSAGHRLLQELLLAGFVRQDGDAKYSVGPGAYAWAAATLSGFEIGKAALPVMRDVVAQCHETVVLTVYDQGALYFVERVECSNPIRYVPPLKNHCHGDAGRDDVPGTVAR